MALSVLIGAFITIFIFAMIGGGIGWWFWKKSRPKVQSWTAKIWQIGEGVRPSSLDEQGNPTSNIDLQDLKPYATDILQKLEVDTGIVKYRLLGLKKLTPPVEADFVDNWGSGNKEVNILLHKGGCTFLKKGYDKESGEQIFSPLPQDTINLIKGEIQDRSARLKKEKDILEAISPWIVAGICILGLIGLAFIMSNSFIKTAKINKETQQLDNANTDKIIAHEKEMIEWRYGINVPPTNSLGPQSSSGPNTTTLTVTE